MTEVDPEEFCVAMLPRLVRSMSLYVGDREAAEDIAQEALARAWERWSRVGAMASPEAWVFQTARNLAHRRWRQNARRVGPTDNDSTVDPDESFDLDVRAAVSRLPKRQKATLIARFFFDLSVADTAALLGCREGTVEAATHQALARLRDDGLIEVETVEVRASE